MITREDSKRIWEQVQANHARLAACASHDFRPVPKYPDQPSHPLKDYVCGQCGGKIDGTAHHWYQQGRRHGAAAAGTQ